LLKPVGAAGSKLVVRVATTGGTITFVQEEENRYLKAYGQKIITEEQLKEVTEDLRARKTALEKEISLWESENQNASEVLMPSEDEIETFCSAAKEVMNNHLSFEAKQVIIQKLVDTVIADQKELKVRGYLPIKEVNNNVEYYSNYRYCWAT